MNRRNVLLIAGAVIGVGLILVLGAFAMSGVQVFSAFSTNKFNNAEMIEESHVFDENVTGIDIQTVASDVRFERSSDGKTRIESRHSAEITETAEVKNGVLTVRQESSRKGGIHIGVSSAEEVLTVYLSQSDFESLSVETVSGDVALSGLSVGRAGFATVSGELELKDLVSDGKLAIETVSGDVELDRCDAAAIGIETTSGEIEGTLRTGKTFEVSTISGDIDVPASEPGAGRCEISTVSGDVELKIEH